MYETFASYPQQLSYVFKTDAWLAAREDANDPPQTHDSAITPK